MRLRAAILGAGNMGKKHAANLMKLGVEIAAVCDSNDEARKSFFNNVKLPNLNSFHNFDEMTAKADFELLFICLPPFAHTGQFEQAAALGKHIFVEKPIALNSAVAKRMVDVAAKNKIKTYVGFHMRRGGAVTKLKSLIDSGKAGRPVLFNGQYQCNSLHTPWWTNAELCGGQILEQAIHIYDMCRHLMGEPKFACGIMGNVCHSHLPNYTVEDVSASIAGFTSGAVASITANNCAIPGKWTGAFSVTYQYLTADFADFNTASFAYTGGDAVEYEEVAADNDPYFDEVAEFLDHVRGDNAAFGCDIAEGYRSLCFVESVVRSAKVDGQKLAVSGCM